MFSYAKTGFGLTLAAILSAGCTREAPVGQDATPGADRVYRISLQIEGEEPETKVDIADGTGSGVWTPGDVIAMYIKGTGANTYTNLTVDVENECVKAGLSSAQDIAFYSVYPSGARVDAQYGNPELQVKYDNQYSLPLNVTAAQLNNWSPVPMVAANTDDSGPLTSVVFYHVGGVLRLKLSNYTKADASRITVTLEGMKDIVGTFRVNAPASLASTGTLVSPLVAGDDNNAVTFLIPSALQGSLPDELWLNVPLPTGNYEDLSGIKVSVVSASQPQSLTKKVQWSQVRHASGKRMSFDMSGAAGALDHVGIGSTEAVTLWAGETHVKTAIGYDAGEMAVPGCTVSWDSSDPAVASVDNNGTVTARTAGSAVMTATVTKGAISKTESYLVYVNEINGIRVDRSSLYGRKGAVSHLTATVDYTSLGSLKSIPQLEWYSSNTGVLTVQNPLLESGKRNTLDALELGNANITIAIPAGKYGSANHSVTVPVRVLGSTYVPGAFSVSPTKQVFFATGNVVVTDTFDGANHSLQWKFADNQWDYFANLPPTTAGQTTTYSYFGWGTGNNPWHTSTLDEDYSTFVDWGIHFDDEGIGDDARTDGTWKTLTKDEWDYLIEDRPKAAILWCFATIVFSSGESVFGIIFLPDDWVAPSDCFLRAASMNVYGATESIQDGDWRQMEENGALFLPGAGMLYERVRFIGLNSGGLYWSSTEYEGANEWEIFAYKMNFSSTGGVYGSLIEHRYDGYTVRLSHD